MLTPDSFWFVLATSFATYALPGFAVAAVGLALLRGGTDPALRPWVSGGLLLAVAGVVLHGVLFLPAVLGDHPTGRPDVVVLSINLKHGHADAGEVLALARRQHAGVLVLAEATSQALHRFEDAGVATTWPHRAGAPARKGDGTLIFSAYPLGRVDSLPLLHGSYQVQVQAAEPFWLVAAHLAQPLVAAGDWRSDWSVLNRVVPDLDGPVVLAGDFNTTLSNRPLRDLLGDGFTDAARTANSGWQPTWPATGLGLIAIDHVISRGYAAVSTDTFHVEGTDHRALVARLVRS